MQKLNLTQSLSQKLSPQQIQFIKLLQIPTAELDSRIEEELGNNPALEEGKDEKNESVQDSNSEEFDSSSDDNIEKVEEINIDDYVNRDDISGYKMYGDGGGGDDDDKEIPIASLSTLMDSLKSQVGYLKLDPHQYSIAMQLIGTIDNDGYIRRPLEAIVNDLAFLQNVETSEEEVEIILKKIHRFDPAGIGARDLKECLLLQLERKSIEKETVERAQRILENCFNEFTKKHYKKIQKRLSITEDELRDAINIIIKLNPKPGGYTNSLIRNQYLTPDFILKNDNGAFLLSLNSRNAPDLRISRSYAEMLDTYDKSDKKDKKIKETVSFVKQKLDAAKWFIDAIKQRQDTLLKTMNCILKHQEEFFLEGDESRLKPMILKDIAEKIQMDISTVSRVANSKSVQTDFGIFPLKFFFSESISTEDGGEVSSKEVKYKLKKIIEVEDKRKPLSDDKIEKALKEMGYNIARRTVAKYREQLGIPVARLRKEI